MTETKVCTKCKVEKPIEEFNKNPHYAGGYKTWCKQCCHTCSYNRHKQRYATDAKFREKTNKYYRDYKLTHRTSDEKAKICSILHAHSEDLKDDPDHLSTEFLQKLIGVKCK